MRRQFSLALIIAAAAVVVPGSTAPAPAAAEQSYRLNIATLAPRGSDWMKVFNAWNASVKKETNGKLQLRFYPGGVAGDERDFIRKMRGGQLDGAAVTGTGLGQIVRPALVLQMPGLFKDYGELDRVRDELDDELQKQFESNGYKLLGWGDVGKGRILSNKPVRKPADLRSTRPWAWREDVIFTEFLKVVGANPVKLGVPEVYPQLQTGMIDTIPSSALAAVSLQWFTQVSHITKQSTSVLIGATLLKKDEYDKLPDDLKKALMSTSDRAHRLLRSKIRKADERAYRTILKRGIKEVDISAHQAEWEKAAKQTRKRLTGKLFPASLLKRVERAKGG